jgi:hypothetical protein
MFGNELSTAQLIAVAIIPTLFAIVVHEVAHGWVAFRLGDDTAYQMGRLKYPLTLTVCIIQDAILRWSP